jgi:acyl-CoA synthetase (AMP-forming)/AMP-acid ligase II
MDVAPTAGLVGDPWTSRTGTSLLRVLRNRAALHGDRVALRFLERGEREADVTTYAELDRAARRIAASLRAAGAVGRPVLVALPQGLDFVLCFLGCLYAGAIGVPTPAWNDPRATDRIRGILANSGPALVVASAPRADMPVHLVTPDELLQGAGIHDAAPLHDPLPSDIAFLQYTSGSTSQPKGVVITHGNIAANLEMIRRAFGQDEGDVTVSWLPLHHDMGLIGCVLEPLYLGASAVLMSPLAFLQRPARWLQAIASYGATTCGAPSFGYEFCLRGGTDTLAPGLDLSRWKLAFCGAEPVRALTLSRFAERFKAAGFSDAAFYPCYGQAEATLFVTGGEAGQGVRVGPDGSVSCGHPWLDTEIVLLASAGDATVADAVGEIAIAGPQVSPGFWDPDRGIVPDPARAVLLAGRSYLRSGDLGRLDDGALHVVGRLRNMIILRGANIHAEDVERTVSDLPAMALLGGVAALRVTGTDEEGIILVCELQRGAALEAAAAALPSLAVAVAEAHGVAPLETLLVAAGGIARTVSGKLQRDATYDLHRSGTLPALARYRSVRARSET